VALGAAFVIAGALLILNSLFEIVWPMP